MSELIFRGRLKNSSNTPYEGCIVVAQYQIARLFEGDTEPTIFPTQQTGVVAREGGFSISVGEQADLRSPITTIASSASGREIARRVVSVEEATAEIEISAEPEVAVPIATHPDPLLGRRARMLGRVLDRRGTKPAAQCQVVVWGIIAQGVPSSALGATKTDADGYFALDYPADSYNDAYGEVACNGMVEKVPILLDGSGRFPRTL
jgi:hypothetical protein